jgi:hypothetical protein
VGLLRGLVLLPLAPVRGVIWVAERIAQQAESEWQDQGAIRRRLDELDLAHELGELSDEEYEAAQDELLERLAAERRPIEGR